jgi:hypothetical protein
MNRENLKMKKSNTYRPLAAAAWGFLAGGYTLLAAPPAPLKPAPQAPATSYAEVTAKLDRGGNVFAYLGTARWLEGLSEKVGELRQIATDMADKNDREDIDLAFDIATRFLERSGLQEISGVGVSTVPVGDETYRTKMFLHHNKDRGDGYVWSLFGDRPHDLTGPDLIPAEAVLASFGDVNITGLWTTLTNEIAALGNAEVNQQWAMLPMLFKQTTQMELNQLLEGLGGEFGWALLLNEKARLPLPIPAMQAVDIPTPELMLVAKVTDQAIFDRISDLMAAIPNVTKVEQDGAHQVIVPALIPFVPALQPVVAYDGEHLVITSNPGLMSRVLAAKKGDGPSLRTNPQFQELVAGLSPTGNGFGFVSDRFAKEILEFQKKMAPAQGAAKDEIGKIMDLFSTPTRTLSVFSNTDEGWLWTSVGNQSAGEVMAAAMVAVPALAAAIAIPNFVKARSTAQKNSCIANLKQLDGATQQWALENKKTARDTPELSPILKYLRGKKLPQCPEGGTYSLGEEVAKDPKCSHPGHSLSGDWAPRPVPTPPLARPTPAKNRCSANLKQIDGATQQWALENRKKATDKPNRTAILKYLRGGAMPVCPEAGTYRFGSQVSQMPTCSHPGHKL